MYALLIFPLSFFPSSCTKVKGSPLKIRRQRYSSTAAHSACGTAGTRGTRSGRCGSPHLASFCSSCCRNCRGAASFLRGNTRRPAPPDCFGGHAFPHKSPYRHQLLRRMPPLYLARYTPWRPVFHEISFPWKHPALRRFCMTPVTLDNHHAILHTPQEQAIERLSALLLYLTLCHTAWYYRPHL